VFSLGVRVSRAFEFWWNAVAAAACPARAIATLYRPQPARDTYASKPPTANRNRNKYDQVLLRVNFLIIAMTILLSQSNEQKSVHLIT